MNLPIVFLQFILFIAAAPFISGLVTKIKNNLRMRKGQSVFQPYYNFAKLFSKGEVVSETASWIFKAAPFVVLASSLTAALLVSILIAPAPENYMGDLLALIFILALGRFFLALSALDTASSFGGMGASREMFISSLVEPAVLLAVFSIFLRTGSTNIQVISATAGISVSSFIAVVTLLLVAIAETSRIPIDNQETHLELTMVHEAMVLEYSGRSLALIELASYIKQMIWFSLIARIVLPAFLPVLAGIFMIAVIIAIIEVSVAKMRLFRITDFLGFAFVLGIIASICAILGV